MTPLAPSIAVANGAATRIAPQAPSHPFPSVLMTMLLSFAHCELKAHAAVQATLKFTDLCFKLVRINLTIRPLDTPENAIPGQGWYNRAEVAGTNGEEALIVVGKAFVIGFKIAHGSKKVPQLNKRKRFIARLYPLIHHLLVGHFDGTPHHNLDTRPGQAKFRGLLGNREKLIKVFLGWTRSPLLIMCPALLE